jgi:TonB dependent receptor
MGTDCSFVGVPEAPERRPAKYFRIPEAKRHRKRAAKALGSNDVLSRYPLIGALTGPVVAIIFVRPAHLSETKVSGIDFDFKYGFSNDLGKFSLGLAGTYVTHYALAATPTSPFLDVLNTYDYPVRIKARAMAGWSNSKWSANAFVNYTGSYKDTGQVITSPYYTISSWTTLDFAAAYRLAWPKETKLMLNGYQRLK